VTVTGTTLLRKGLAVNGRQCRREMDVDGKDPASDALLSAGGWPEAGLGVLRGCLDERSQDSSRAIVARGDRAGARNLKDNTETRETFLVINGK
jgi:hypothetical protein